MRYAIVTETYPPDVNGVALTVQSLEQGLRELGHRVALVRTEHDKDRSDGVADLMTVAGAPVPSYPGLRFGLPAGRRLQARWAAQRPDAIYIATEGPLGWSALRSATRLGIPVATGFHTRFDDYIGRYGGDEFLLVLTQTPVAGARECADRFRRALEALSATEIGAGLAVTISVGITEYRVRESITQTVRRADAALYRAKAGGRNRIECAPTGQLAQSAR